MRAGAAGVSGLAALVLLLPMEAGVPIPLPADLVMFTVGERVAAGRFRLGELAEKTGARDTLPRG
jgi:hypothetical protein